jgi:hypothetical protein
MYLELLIVAIGLNSVGYFNPDILVESMSCQWSSHSQQDRVKFDSFFNKESKRTQKVHLDNFVKELHRRPLETAYIISYSGSKSESAVTKRTRILIKNYLKRIKATDRRKIVFLVGGKLSRGMTELFFVPPGADAPKPSPPL